MRAPYALFPCSSCALWVVRPLRLMIRNQKPIVRVEPLGPLVDVLSDGSSPPAVTLQPLLLSADGIDQNLKFTQNMNRTIFYFSQSKRYRGAAMVDGR